MSSVEPVKTEIIDIPGPKESAGSQEELKDEGDLPKLWDVRDPFQYAPPKPDGDPWTILVEPLLRNDKMQCDAWKDEVQNLLIFAGLFSAIVTAFIVESYKNLQENPNDVMVTLLSQIASRLDGPLNSSAAALAPPNQTLFFPDASSIRVNAFWFISLVLSLTTVLVGIVSLQWLREHLVYSDLSPREKYATYHMRAEGLKKWHVDKIFTAMPLLLQCALVLFLGGIIDFLHAIGYWTVTIPVTVVVAFTLTFLIATTFLPCLQLISLYIHFSTKSGRPPGPQSPPSQCPYKSPQSHAICAIFRPIPPLCSRLYESLYPRFRSFLHMIGLSEKPASSFPFYPQAVFTRYLYRASQFLRWIDFDEAWLSIRDAYMRRALNKSLDQWHPGLGHGDVNILPIYDIVDALCSQSWQKSFAIPAYHCFDEISESVGVEEWNSQSPYLHSLLSNAKDLTGDACLSDFIPESVTFVDVLRQQNTFLFLRFHYVWSEVPLLAKLKLELGLRLMKYFYQERRAVYTSNLEYQKIPYCLTFKPLITDLSMPLTLEHEVSWKIELLRQIGSLALSLLHQLEEHSDADNILPNVLGQQNYLTALLSIAAYFTASVRQYGAPNRTANPLESATERVFEAIPTLLEQRIAAEIPVASSTEYTPSALFYLAALYLYSLPPAVILEHSYCVSLWYTLSRYKERTIDKSMTDPDTEKRLQLCYQELGLWFCQSDDVVFSKEWWNDFIDRIPKVSSGLSSSGPTSPSNVIIDPSDDTPQDQA